MTRVRNLPYGVSDFEDDGSTWTMKVSIPVDPLGFFGRVCPGCRGFFKIRSDEFIAAPNELQLCCPYCGHVGAPRDFLSTDQRERAISAAKAAAIGKFRQMLQDAMPTTRGSGGMLSISMELKPGTPPSLYTYVEQEVRRTITCEKCQRSSAVYGAATYCPYCGPRNIAPRVLDEIAAQRRALSLFDHLPESVRVEAQAAGVIDSTAADTLKNVVTMFEQFSRETFELMTAHTPGLLRGERPNVFQNLDDAERLFAANTSLQLRSIVGPDLRERMRVTFAKRHVLTHRGGIVDQRFLDQVPGSGLALGQRLVVSRPEASQALDDLEGMVRVAISHIM